MPDAKLIELACLMEATAPKPGNVYPGKAFDDLCFDDFVQAARAISNPLAALPGIGLGQRILHAVKETRAATGTNVNLGIVLLLAPLAAVPTDVPLELGIHAVLASTTIDDAELVYEAIRLAQPGGLGQVDSQDVAARPTISLKAAMALAADRDRIAEQYVTDYQLVFAARRELCAQLVRSSSWQHAIVYLHLWILSLWPDTLIARKCGVTIADEASTRARSLIARAADMTEVDSTELQNFDTWLRADGHRRNPGTTADLIAATLYAGLRDGMVQGQMVPFASLADDAK